MEGIDFDDRYAPTSPTSQRATLRACLAVAAEGDLPMAQLGAKTAFLNGSLDEPVYMHQPEGFSVGGQRKVMCLKKALYG